MTWLMDGWMAWYVGKYNFQTRNNILTSFNLTLYQWPENNRNNENWSKSLLFNLSKNCCNCQFFISSLVVTRAEFSVPISLCTRFYKIIACYYIGYVIYWVFIKYCVFFLKFCDFSELCKFCCSAGVVQYTHWHRGKTEKGQSTEFSKILGKNTIFN